jgi:uncharacterized phage protein (TIGR02220 family)
VNRTAEERGIYVVSNELPEPPYPADTKTKGWRFELDLQRVWKSDTWVLCSPDMRPWLYHIWAVAFEQEPAGSLPRDHALIAAHIGMDQRMFAAHSDVLLRGFRLHSDNRLYHPVVCDRVKKLLGYRDGERERKAKYRNKMKNMETCPTGQTRDGQGIPVGETLQEQEQEQEQEEREEVAKATLSGKSPTMRVSKEDVERVLAHLNERAGTHYRRLNNDGKESKTAGLVRARIKEHGVDALLAVIDYKVNAWIDDDNMRAYLRPSTLFGAEKCEQYVGENKQRKTGTSDLWGNFV